MRSAGGGWWGHVRRAPLLVKAGAGCGVVAGSTLGFMVSAPFGLFLGVLLGAAIGVVAGVVMDRDERRSSLRHRELDDIIGVTSGSLGAPPSVPPPGTEAAARDREQELRSWVTEWMTPPPPATR